MIEKNEKFTLDVDTVYLAFSILRKLDSGNVSNFDERLKSQKLQYLAQAFKVSPNYNFSFYIHGPYSPGLANDLFAINEKKISPDLSEFIPSELTDRFDLLKKFVEDKNNRKLELVTTFHLFRKVLNLEEKDAKEKIKKFKNATEDEINYSIAEIEKIPC